MILYVVRHAWAGHHGDPGWPDDSLRELTPEGAERYRTVARELGGRGVAPARIATSPYPRGLQTAQILSEETPGAPPVDELDALTPGTDLAEALSWCLEFPDDDLAWVGHNPDVEWIVPELIGDADAYVRFAKGSTAAVEFDGAPQVGEGVLLWHVTAKALGL